MVLIPVSKFYSDDLILTPAMAVSFWDRLQNNYIESLLDPEYWTKFQVNNASKTLIDNFTSNCRTILFAVEIETKVDMRYLKHHFMS